MANRNFYVVLIFSFFFTFKGKSQTGKNEKVDSLKKEVPLSVIKRFELYERPYYGNHSFKTFSRSKFLLLPKQKIDFFLDKSGQFMQITDKINDFEYTPSIRIPYSEFKKNEFRAIDRAYWSSINLKKEQEEGQLLEKAGRLPRIPLGKAAGLFGGSFIDLKANVSGTFDLGARFSRLDNPQIPINQRTQINIQPDFQFKAGVDGTVGKRLSIGFGFDSKPYNLLTQTKVKFDYTLPDHTILQNIELFNTSFNPKNSLIPGSQNLLGGRVNLRFGKLHIDALGGLKRGASNIAHFKKGANIQNINIKADRYIYNRYFFLGYFFRNNYESSLQTLPIVNSNIQITRLEVYITNRSNNSQDLRNIASFLDLAEVEPFNPRWQAQPDPTNNNANDNSRNTLFSELQNINRNVQEITGDLENNNLVEGIDFEILTAARKLEPNEYYFHKELGYIGLRQPISDDEVLAVAYEYTFNGQRFQVGELTENYQDIEDNEVIFLKMLRPSSIQTEIPTWDLMMKNVYSLGVNQINEEGFRLQVIYKDDATGQDRPIITEGINTRNQPLVQLLNADQLNSKLDPQPDGNFDFVEGVTIESQYGILIFPALEPFGSSLENLFASSEQSLVNRYVFNDLYNLTQIDAQQNTTKNKFAFIGNIQGAPSNVLFINTPNLAENSVKVRIGNTVLVENRDYTVNYLSKTVTINNIGLLNTDETITVEYEQGDVFSVRNRTLLGFEASYNLTDEISFSGTFLHLSERPTISTTRVSIGNEPIKNTVIGLKGNYTSESLLLTKIVDKLPFVSTKAISKFSIQGEAAQLIPGLGSLAGNTKGVSYIDDFETIEKIIPLSSVSNWKYASTPIRFLETLPLNMQNALPRNYRRAKLSWYSIDNSFYQNNLGSFVQNQSLNHYDRRVLSTEVFPLKSINNSANSFAFLQTFDIAYYPEERGVYNYNPNLNPDNTLPNPENNFGSIAFGITGDNVDFDKQNIQYIEFWLLNPFLTGGNGRVEEENNNTGGTVFFNLGNISEDFIPDGQHLFENGLNQDPISSDAVWGRVPNQPFIINGFGTQPRNVQDLGFDGLNNEEERIFFASRFLDLLPPQNNQLVFEDPSADDFLHFNDPVFDGEERIVARYKNFRGVENNSIENTVLSSTILPDNEDINNDNTINSIESYFEYRLDLRPDMQVGDPYIVDKIDNEIDGELVTWYQVRIPIRDPKRAVINNLDGFKNIRFMRLYLTNWQQPVVLRISNFQIAGTFWREYEESLITPGLGLDNDNFGDTDFTVSTVNIEENGSGDSQNAVPYNLPPDFVRDPDPNTPLSNGISNLKNEQSLQFDIQNLGYNDSRAAFRNLSLDLINYGRLRLEIHAHSSDIQTQNGDFTAFIRIGTDPNENYYEISIPLTLTPLNTTFDERERLWPEENQINLAFDELFQVKSIRDRQNFSEVLPFSIASDKYTITLKGRPDLSAAQVVFLGIRNDANDNQDHDITVWFNELRVSDFNTQGGGAFNVLSTIQLADFANVNANISYRGTGYGSVQSKPNQRQRSDQLRYEINANINVDKIGLDRLGIKLPVYLSYSETTTKPFFDPQDKDVPLSIALETLPESEQNAYQTNAESRAVKRSISIPNFSKTKRPNAKKYIWDIENLSLNAAYSDEKRSDTLIQSYYSQNMQAGAVYNFKFKTISIEPFKKKDKKRDKNKDGRQNSSSANIPTPRNVRKSDPLAFIKNFNFSLLPSSVRVSGNLNRQYEEVFYRGDNLANELQFLEPLFRKQFTFDRDYQLVWNFTKNFKFNYNALTNAIIDEPFGALDTQEKIDSVLDNLKDFGRIKNFSQKAKFAYVFPANTLPYLDLINNPSFSYDIDYAWRSARLGQEEIFGHSIENSRNFNVSTGLDIKKLYAKSSWLNQKITKKLYQDKSRPDYLNSPTNQKIIKLKAKFKILTEQAAVLRKRQEKIESNYTQALEILKADSIYDQERLKKNNAIFKLKRDKLQNQRQEITKKQQEIRKDIQTYTNKLNEMRRNKVVPQNYTGLKILLRTLTGLKSINFKYNRKESTFLPGYVLRPKFLGFDETWQAPGLDFILGNQNRDILLRAEQSGWLLKNSQQIQPFTQRLQESYTLSAKFNILNDLKIDVSFQKQRGATYNEVFRYDSLDNTFNSQSPFRNGNYQISYGLYEGFLDPKNSLELLQNFSNYLPVIQSRRIEEHPQNFEYDTISQDVLIPAFIAAYNQKDPNTISLTNFPTLPLPNWKINYEGLGKIPFIKQLFKNFSLEHNYSSTFEIGAYRSSLLYLAEAVNLGIQEQNFIAPIFNDSTGQLTPVVILDAVIINEQFAPLIGFNATTLNNLKFGFKYGKGRTLTLNLNNVQITEVNNSDYSFMFSFSKKRFLLPFKIQGRSTTLPNLLTFNLNATVRDTETVQHIEQDGFFISNTTNGSLNFQVRGTLNYQFIPKNQNGFTLDGGLYVERMVIRPSVQNINFPRFNTSVGLLFKVLFTQ